MPNLDALAEFRKLIGPSVPIFLLPKDGSEHITLFMPPVERSDRFIQRLSANGGLSPFLPCAKPIDRGRMKILFGDDADLDEYFPRT